MNIARRNFLQLAAGLAAMAVPSLKAQAQDFPNKPITIIVPFPAGGPSDTIARLLGAHMRNSLGQPVIVENVVGANGSIAGGRVARAAADGHTLLIGQTGTQVFNGAIYPLQYDVMKDFAPIALLTDSPLLIVGKKSLAPNDLKGLVTWLKDNPDKGLAGIPGIGSIAHIAFVSLQKQTGTSFSLVPYRGVAPVIQDLVAGQIDFTITDPISTLPHVRSGALKGLAMAANERLAVAPDIPTTAESGVPDMTASVWHGLWAPAGTPAATIDKINKAVVAALADEQIHAKLKDLGQGIVAPSRQTPQALADFQKAEIDKWWPVIKAANIKPN
jgi:tripartite-type tricarboxylate transporter receptor subunit TctC